MRHNEQTTSCMGMGASCTLWNVYSASFNYVMSCSSPISGSQRSYAEARRLSDLHGKRPEMVSPCRTNTNAFWKLSQSVRRSWSWSQCVRGSSEPSRVKDPCRELYDSYMSQLNWLRTSSSPRQFYPSTTPLHIIYVHISWDRSAIATSMVLSLLLMQGRPDLHISLLKESNHPCPCLKVILST